jgi:hypothetical protein
MRWTVTVFGVDDDGHDVIKLELPCKGVGTLEIEHDDTYYTVEMWPKKRRVFTTETETESADIPF